MSEHKGNPLNAEGAAKPGSGETGHPAPESRETRAKGLEAVRNMTAEELEQRRAQLAEEIQTADEAGLDFINAELSAMEARSRELAAAEIETRRRNMLDVIHGAGTVIGASPDRETRSQENRLKELLDSEKYLNAYVKRVRDKDERECRALLTNLVTDGSVPVPTYVNQEITNAWSRLSILPRMYRVSIPGNTEFPFELSTTAATVHTEGAAAPAEEDLKLGSVRIVPQSIVKHLSFSKAVSVMGGRAFVDYVYREIEYQNLKLLENMAIDAIKAAPATATKTAASVSSLPVSAIDAATIFAALALLSDQAANPVAIMHRQTYFNSFMGLKDTTGRPIYEIVSNNGAPSYFINGVEVLFSDSLTAEKEVIVGDLNGLVVNMPDGSGVDLLTDIYSLSDRGMIKIVGSLMAGFGVIRDKAFTKVTVSSGSGNG